MIPYQSRLARRQKWYSTWLTRLIEAVESPCVLGSNNYCSLARAMDGRVMRRGIIGSCQSAPTFRIVKALLVTSMTHVSSAIASTSAFTFLPFTSCNLSQCVYLSVVTPTVAIYVKTNKDRPIGLLTACKYSARTLISSDIRLIRTFAGVL